LGRERRGGGVRWEDEKRRKDIGCQYFVKDRDQNSLNLEMKRGKRERMGAHSDEGEGRKEGEKLEVWIHYSQKKKKKTGQVGQERNRMSFEVRGKKKQSSLGEGNLFSVK